MKRLAEVVPLNQSATDRNWRALLGDALTRKNVRGAAVVIFYRDRTHTIGWSGVRCGDIALAGARLLKLSVDE